MPQADTTTDEPLALAGWHLPDLIADAVEKVLARHGLITLPDSAYEDEE